MNWNIGWNNEIKRYQQKLEYNQISNRSDKLKKHIVFKTFGFTYLNPHVYSDTVFILGNFSKNFDLTQKIIFGIGASSASFLFFFLLGYASNYFSQHLNSKEIWKVINWIIIGIMSVLTLYVLREIYISII